VGLGMATIILTVGTEDMDTVTVIPATERISILLVPGLVSCGSFIEAKAVVGQIKNQQRVSFIQACRQRDID